MPGPTRTPRWSRVETEERGLPAARGRGQTVVGEVGIGGSGAVRVGPGTHAPVGATWLIPWRFPPDLDKNHVLLRNAKHGRNPNHGNPRRCPRLRQSKEVIVLAFEEHL